MNKLIRRSQRLYGLVVKLYPKSYQQDFAKEMKYVFSESLKDAFSENGKHGITTLWARTMIDTSKSLVTQHLESKKGNVMKVKHADIIMQNKVFIWIAAVTGLILSIPLIAMQFTSEVQWDLGDFIIMGILIFGAGFTFVHIARITPRKYRILVGLACLLVLLWLWAELAVGVFTNWGS